ncbi:uncharacterized protein LOC142357262 isoform X2 [Convolutriloba macropyga]|uniref:uncharacterized protein LOC142357262 isoform X2 n=1 Tax=Convolutriloba macropyga TaxID=536237 RepID=UPI003F527BCF
MSTYGKYTPYRQQKSVLQRRNALFGHAAFTLNTELELSEKPDQNEQPNEQPINDNTSAKQILKYSTFRLVESIFPQVEDAEHIVFRVIWVLIYLGLFVAFAFTFHNLVDKYTNYPTTFDLTIETDTSLEFPEVTVCNENPVKKSDLLEFNQQHSDLIILQEFLENQFSDYNIRLNRWNIPGKKHHCPKENYFTCEDQNYCIPPQWVCDGKVQCEDGSDENRETDRCHEESLRRIENGGHSYYCVPPYMECPSSEGDHELICAKKCDQNVECKNATDEFNSRFNCTLTYEEDELLFAETFPKNLTSPRYKKIAHRPAYFWRVIKTNESFTISIDIYHLYLQWGRDKFGSDTLWILEGERGPALVSAIMKGYRELGARDIKLSHDWENDFRHNARRPLSINSSAVTLYLHRARQYSLASYNISYRAVPRQAWKPSPPSNTTRQTKNDTQVNCIIKPCRDRQIPLRRGS